MKFESQYLIKWGMPGWVFMLLVLPVLYLGGTIDSTGIQNMHTISAAFALTLIGIVVGYIIYQIYFVLSWIYQPPEKRNINKIIEIVQHKGIEVPKNWNERFFLIEYLWHANVKELEEYKMIYYSNRYSYLLTRKHEIGALLTSFGLCIVPVSVELISAPSLLLFGIFLFTCVMSWVLFKTFNYYSTNVEYVVARFMDEILPPARENNTPKNEKEKPPVDVY
ncbi:hypothetical protein [Halobacillus sp. A5]|uniref:hypothetical protein n=1 Tax=Halobacillus sp. A5 TaxID=2880263 RepID=UPI0020A656C9|nr:hypothetical protein [Halobacillus sp. A5]MCP3026864.1 hypothetical protein [Halobacillus sp. A5]